VVFGNRFFHYSVPGPAIVEVFLVIAGPGSRLAAFVSATGSAGTIGAGDYVKKRYGGARIVASEALQCPTLLRNGFGGHRIEGIGDKHVPWIHNVRNTDAVIAVDDADCMTLLRLFNEPEGRRRLAAAGVPDGTIASLPLLGISGIANLLASIKLARACGFSEDDVVVTILTDSLDLYGSRLVELTEAEGPFDREAAVRAHAVSLAGQGADHVLELTERERRRIHNLKYYTWVEQQGKRIEDLDAQWDDPALWRRVQQQAPLIDEAIAEFNREVGIAR